MSSTPCAARTAPRHSLQITAQSLVSPVPRLDARRCAWSISDSYAGRLVGDTGGASGERGFGVLTLLPHRASTRSIPHVRAYKEGFTGAESRQVRPPGADAMPLHPQARPLQLRAERWIGQMMLLSNKLRIAGSGWRSRPRFSPQSTTRLPACCAFGPPRPRTGPAPVSPERRIAPGAAPG